ncbi:hypothetical protein CCAX7_48410 [Capsulimonas corticalis]|uniref:Uncharacterized protein n=1 Tax=Capsulimonas corticalis TaxID=2219043 RepID=A0A402CQB3_9BACT|nr:hypothetical protein [Capsulimonas corticalis]BDI32790.1 hypothetical protein CCAX7_48410 [Capsulimonas corticalis]
MDQQAASKPEEIWRQAFYRVQRTLDIPIVWMAMEAARPLALDGNHLIVGLDPNDRYLSVNLQTHEYATVIDDALAEVAGRPLALHIIEGFSLEDYKARQAQELVSSAPEPAPPAAAANHQETAAPAPPRSAPSAPARAAQAGHMDEVVELIPHWDKLNERLTVAFKHAPLARYPHGQAAFLLHAVKLISATMDHFMDAPFGQADPIQERALAKCVERLGVTVSLDPFFISLELIRYRRDQGRDVGGFPPA